MIAQIADGLVEEVSGLLSLARQEHIPRLISTDFPEAKLNQKQLDKVISKLKRRNRR
jgi:hypothetical protein